MVVYMSEALVVIGVKHRDARLWAGLFGCFGVGLNGQRKTTHQELHSRDEWESSLMSEDEQVFASAADTNSVVVRLA